MTSAKRGRVVRMAAVAALGLALSACGDGIGSSSDVAVASESPVPGSLPAQGSATPPGVAPTQDSAPSQSSAPAQESGSGVIDDNPPAAHAATVTINWTPPTENTDGTTLENLAGYKIHYGTASKKYTQTITVSNPGLATYVISSLPAGTYYFSVTAYNATGTESPFSSEVSAKVD